MVSKYDVVVSTESDFISIRNFGDDLFTPISNSQHDLSIKIKCERLKEIAYPSIVSILRSSDSFVILVS